MCVAVLTGTVHWKERRRGIMIHVSVREPDAVATRTASDLLPTFPHSVLLSDAAPRARFAAALLQRLRELLHVRARLHPHCAKRIIHFLRGAFELVVQLQHTASAVVRNVVEDVHATVARPVEAAPGDALA